MKISFVIIAYNEERNIKRTIDAILRQSKLDSYEIVVVNDGSKDRTLEVVEAIKHTSIRIVDIQPNQGRGAARAAGVKAAKGDLLAFVDADIVLPAHWISTCLKFIKTYDACGGTAVPDGDVSFVHRIFELTPKVAPHTTAVTGSNGLFRKEVFNTVSFNSEKSDGEDVDLGYQIAESNLKTFTVPNLIVEHRETKTFAESMEWLYVSGIGASRQLYEHQEVRLPDIAFLGFIGSIFAVVLAIIFLPLPTLLLASLPLLYLVLSSTLHLHVKFKLQETAIRSALAVIVNTCLLFAYYSGRLIGLTIGWRKS